MNDLKELSDYVVEHPEAYDSRWRLAKKLYMAWEYNEALRHLLILKKNWTRKLNVLRYLAATLYRLGRYKEAIEELEGILVQWPNELPVWEQLAKVREVMGENEKAAQAWEQVIRLDPDHSLAGRAVRRLRAHPGDTPRDKLHLADSDSGINLSAGKVCASCGAQNSDEFDRCWQCHALLRHGERLTDLRAAPRTPTTILWFRPLLGGFAAVATLSIAMYLALTHFPADSARDEVPRTVYDALGVALYDARAAVGLVLVVASPILLLAGFRIAGIRGLNVIDAIGAGILVASSTYALCWVPVAYAYVVFAGPALASAFIVLLYLPGERFSRIMGAWSLHALLATSVGAAAWFGAAGLEPVRDWPSIARFAQSSVTAAAATPLPKRSAPYQFTLIWASSGSPWLDQQSNRVELEFTTDQADLPMTVGLSDDITHVISRSPDRMSIQVVPGKLYVLRAPEDASFEATVRSLLPVSIAR